MNRSLRFVPLALVPALTLALAAQADTPPAKTSTPASASTAAAPAKSTVPATATTTMKPATATTPAAAPAASATPKATATVAATTAVAPTTTTKPATAAAPMAAPVAPATAKTAASTASATTTAPAATAKPTTAATPAAASAAPATPKAAVATAPIATKTTTITAAPAVSSNTTPSSAPPASSSDIASLDTVIAGDWRKPANVARDQYRHPKETLLFFGVKPDQTLLEITPGGGWYTEILAPLMRDHGHYIAILPDPAYETDTRAKDDDTKQVANLDGLHNAHPDVYAKAEMHKFTSRKAPVLGTPGSADVVVTFRNVHNWVMAGDQAAMFKAFYDVLKPGGVLGVTDHRANPGPATDGKMGYLTEQQVIDYATAAGFVLDAKSEINANPKDTKDYPHGVWTLPPTLSQGNHGIGTYTRIGESDRMTLRFHKPNK